MNKSFIRHSLSLCLGLEAIFLMFTSLIALIYQEKGFMEYFLTGLFIGIPCLYSILKRPKSDIFFAKEGFIIVGLSWILLSIIGALPPFLLKETNNYVDALFEIVSGFTTTGATIAKDVTSFSHATLFWRSFTHWIGGMGMLVFTLAIMPSAEGRAIYILKAEAPGPYVGKLVSKLSNTAKILYSIYTGLTVLQIISLLLCKMSFFESLTLSLATAGTGGFSLLNDSFVSYSASVQIITAIFMILFGINFNLFYFLLIRDFKNSLKCEEVFWYLGIILVSVLLISINVIYYFDSFKEAFLHAFFNVASIITTTGFASCDYNLWPEFSKTILLILMFIGACAGSTGGGIKVSRIVIMLKDFKNTLHHYLFPKKVRHIFFEGKALNDELVYSIRSYISIYFFIYFISLLLISLNNLDFTTNFSAVAACFNNVGPAFNLAGPMSNYACFNGLSKMVLIFDMLAGRLELIPILILFLFLKGGHKQVKVIEDD